MTLVTAALIGLLYFCSVNLSVFNPIKTALEDFSITDVYFEALRSDTRELNGDIVIVDMTRQRDRAEIARTLRDITACQPKTVCADLIFETQSDQPLADAELVSAIDSVPQLVLSSKIIGYEPDRDEFRSVVKSFFSEFGTYDWGYGNLPSKNGRGCVRQFTIAETQDGAPIYSLAYLSACRYAGETPAPQTHNLRHIVYIDTDFPVVSCDSVLQNADLIRNRLVMVGTMDEQSDMHITPIGVMPGVKIQAFAALTYLRHKEINDMPTWVGLALAFALCYLLAFMGLRLQQRYPKTAIYRFKLIYFAISAFFVWAGFFSFIQFDYNINLLYPLLVIALIETARLIYSGCVNYLGHHGVRLAQQSAYFK